MRDEKTAPLRGVLTLITGAEQFLVEREMTRLVGVARAEDSGSSVTTTAANELTVGLLDQMAGNDLFSSSMIVCITAVEKVPKEVESALVRMAGQVPDDVALIVTHGGSNHGSKALLPTLTSLAAQVIDFPAIKAWDLPQFVTAEARAKGMRIDSEAAAALVDAVGQDTRALSAAVAQLINDVDAEVISLSLVTQYFAGRASVTAYAVSDDALAGKVGDAIMKLRWALSTGVSHPQVTSAMAVSLRQIGTYLAASRSHRPTPNEIGIPQWKLKSIAAAAHSWSEHAVAGAIRAVATADAQVKGASQDPAFALERLIIRLASLRRMARR